ncbi:MFS transporter [Paenibacillus albiflavus]|uniref:MFS transporter n=1 Tax=Paenibacillus albiflavus TaxID=2545760 RepID=A0A4R4EBR6_9BACL|nr:MFS transporter [Paenibacillus albiflavus]TCZ76573.1 MFS transporter [Paenibacillus albiflavus]
MLALLRNRSYLNLWLAQIVSQLGDGITKLLIVYLATHLSDNPIVISFVILSQIIPSTIFGSFAGPLVDRFSKKTIMFSSDIYRAVIVLLMIPSQNSLTLLLILIFLEGIGSLFFDPARSAIVPRIVGKENVTKAISISQATATAMRMIGPAIGGVLIGFHDFTAIFSITVVTYLISAVFIIFITNVQTKSQGSNKPKESYIESYKEGFRVLFNNQGLLAVILLLLPTMLVVGIINTNMDAVLLYTFKVPPAHFGFLETSFGIGSLFGAIAASYLISKLLPHKMMLGSLCAIGVICLLILPLESLHAMLGLPPIYGWILILGIACALINVPLGSLFITLTPDHARGRGAAIFGSLANTMTVIGVLLGGTLASTIGIVYSLAIGGALLVVVTLLFPMLKYYQALKNINQYQGTETNSSETASSA